MPKYFFAPHQFQDGAIALDGDTAHHLLHVLRLTPGSQLTLCDGAETDYAVTIEHIYPKKPLLICKVDSAAPALTEPETAITLYQGLPKGDKLETIIQKCVELGVHQIIPVATGRSVVKLKADAKKTARYQRIAESAAGQSMRGIVPKVADAISFETALAHMDCEALTLVAYEEEKHLSLKHALTQPACKKINLWIGPEGGFDAEEVDALAKKGACIVTLGKRILRTETAAIAMLAQVLCLTET